MIKPNLKRIFLDTNILMYDFIARNEFYQERLPENFYMSLINATEQAIKFIRKDKNFITYTASFSIPRLASLLSQRPLRVPTLDIIDEIERISSKNRIMRLPETSIETLINIVKNTENLHNVDVEDSFQWKLCTEAKCYYFMTANIRDFNEFSDIQIIHPSNYRRINY